jgi:peroxiredoxin
MSAAWSFRRSAVARRATAHGRRQCRLCGDVEIAAASALSEASRAVIPGAASTDEGSGAVPNRRNVVRASIVVVAAVALAAAIASAADAPKLPAAAAAALDAFRAVPWGDRCKPSRPDPAPDGWQQRVKTESALAALDARDAPALEALLLDADRFVRAQAARALGLTSGPGSTPALAAALAAEKDKLARIALIEALGRTGGEGALAAVEAQQTPGADADISWMVGLARRQLKGGRWDIDNLRAEFVDAGRAKFATAEIGKEAPDLALPSATKPVTLGPYKGKVVVIVFTHGDRDTVGEKVLQRMTMEKDRLDKMEVQVIVVDPHEKERTLAWSQKMTLPHMVFASDPAARAASTYGVAKQLVAGGEWQPSPAWFVVDRRGILVWSKVGRQQQDHASLGELMPVLDRVSLNISLK